MKKYQALWFFMLISFTTLFGQRVIQGFVYDEASGESLPGVFVQSSTGEAWTLTNGQGLYTFSVDKDTLTLFFSCLGYLSHKIEVLVSGGKILRLDVRLEQEAVALPTVEVVGGNEVSRNRMSQLAPLGLRQLRTLPQLGGEIDLLKALAFNPGISNSVEGSANLLIRGGSPDQNLVLLDGAPIYNPVHLGGFLSIVSDDMVKSLDAYKGGFPARYGGRLSSVIDIATIDGGQKEWHGAVSAGLITSGLSLNGPLIKDRLTAAASLRTSYAGLIAALFQDSGYQSGLRGNRTDFFILDGHLKLQYRFNDHHQLNFSFYQGGDTGFQQERNSTNMDGSEELGRVETSWGNRAITLRYRYLGQKGWMWRVAALQSIYDYSFSDAAIVARYPNLQSKLIKTSNTGVNDWSLQVAANKQVGKHSLQMGLQWTGHRYAIEALESLYESAMDDIPEINRDSSLLQQQMSLKEGSLYLADEISISPKFSLHLGLRYSIAWRKEMVYGGLEPRLGLQWKMRQGSSIRLSFDRMRQYVHLLENGGLGFPNNIWLPVTERLPASLSDQVSLSFTKENKQKGWYLETSLFAKRLSGLTQLTPRSKSFFSLNENWQEELLGEGRGRVVGLEVFVEKTWEKLTSSVSYTLSKSDRRFSQINENNWFPYTFDRRHNFSILLSWKLGKRWQLTGAWTYQTGIAVTVPIAATLDYPIFGEVNNGRLSDYHRLDFSAVYKKEVPKGRQHRLIYSLYNAYNRANPFYLNIVHRPITILNANSQPVTVSSFVFRQVSLFPIVPSISYQFRF